MSTEPDNKARYIKLIKNTVIASILITLSLTLLQIPKDFFGEAVGIADEGTGDITFAKIEDKDCQNREVVNIDGRRYVVTDTGEKLGALTETSKLSVVTNFGVYTEAYTINNVSFLRPFSDCQGFWKGYFADISYYRDADGHIFSTEYSYQEYKASKGMGGTAPVTNSRKWWTRKFTEIGGGRWLWRRLVEYEKDSKNTISN